MKWTLAKYFNNLIKPYSIIVNMILLGILGYLSKYALNIILSHYLTPALFGDFNLAVRVLAIISSLALLGTNNSAKRFLSYYLQQEKFDTLQHYINWNLHLIRFSFLLCVIIGIVSFIGMKALHIWHIKDIRTYHLTIYMLWVAPLTAAFTLLASYLVCANYPVFNTILQNSKNFVLILVFLGIIYIASPPLDSLTMLTVVFYSYLLILFVETIFIMTQTPQLFRSIIKALNSRNKTFIDPSWLRVSTHLALNTLLCTVIFSIDLIVIELMLPNKENAGFYAAALTITNCLLIVPQNAFTSIKAKISQLAETQEGRLNIEHELTMINRICFAITCGLSIALFLYAKTLLTHFGSIYIQAAPTVRILTIGFAIAAYSQSATAVLAYSGQESMLLRLSIYELILLCLLAPVLTYFYGIAGTAIATTLVIASKTIAFHYVAYMKTNIRAYML